MVGDNDGGGAGGGRLVWGGGSDIETRDSSLLMRIALWVVGGKGRCDDDSCRVEG